MGPLSTDLAFRALVTRVTLTGGPQERPGAGCAQGFDDTFLYGVNREVSAVPFPGEFLDQNVQGS